MIERQEIEHLQEVGLVPQNVSAVNDPATKDLAAAVLHNQASPSFRPLVELTGEVVLEALRGNRGDDQRAIAEKGIEIVELLLRKNADYGSSAWQVPLLAPTLAADVGILVRASDKIRRLERLLGGHQAEVSDESLDQTIDDLIGYLMLYRVRSLRSR